MQSSGGCMELPAWRGRQETDETNSLSVVTKLRLQLWPNVFVFVFVKPIVFDSDYLNGPKRQVYKVFSLRWHMLCFFYVFNIKWLGKWAMWENISLGGVIAVIIVRYSIQNDIQLGICCFQIILCKSLNIRCKPIIFLLIIDLCFPVNCPNKNWWS